MFGKDEKNIIKAMRRNRREEEIRMYGHPIMFHTVERDKTKFSRKIKHKLLNFD